MEILEMVFQDNLNPKKVATTNGGEYHSPCPGCGGKDRFIIWSEKNRYYCRKCQKTGDVIQYLRDFHNLSFKEACLQTNIKPKENQHSYQIKLIDFKPIKQAFPCPAWQTSANNFILNCHLALLNNEKRITLLSERGFSIDSIKKFQLGWNSHSHYENWLINAEIEKIWLPQGIVIPSFVQQKVHKIKIRRTDWFPNDKYSKYIEIHGSGSGFIAYGSNLFLPPILLESELDAMLVQQEAEDLCLPIALGGASKKPDSFIHSILINNPLILFSLDFDEAGIAAFKWWRNHYKNLRLWFSPSEKSVGDAFVKGLNIRDWISQGFQNIKSL